LLFHGDATLIATAISELARQHWSYARKGESGLKMVHGSSRQGILIIASDSGPGIPDIVKQCETGFDIGKPWTGAAGVRPPVDEFEITSEPDQGTIVT